MANLVSVIIPCYNQACFLIDCINSVRAQSYGNWEAIIVDDGSPDETKEVAERLISIDDRIRLVGKLNGGLSSARNAGIEVAKGQYIQFLDADDAIAPEKLSIQVKALNEFTDERLALSDYVCAKEAITNIVAPYLPTRYNGRITIYELCGDWETRISIPQHCVLYSREIFDNGLRFDELLPNHEDWDFLVGAFLQCRNIIHTPFPLAIYRQRSNSMSKNFSKMRTGFLAAIDKRLDEKLEVPGLHVLLRAKRAETNACYSEVESAQRLSRSYSRRLLGLLRRLVRKLINQSQHFVELVTLFVSSLRRT